MNPERSGPGARRAGYLRHGALTPYLFLLPGVLLFVAFRLYPLLDGLRLSFTNARLGRVQYAFVGLANYEKLLDDSRFQVSLVNTAFYTVASTLPILAVPLVLAVFLDRGIPLRTVLRSAFFFPFTLSVVTVGLTWLWLLDPVVGPFNYYLKAAGVPVRAWLADPSTAMWSIILTTVWWVTGYYLVIYLAGLQDIPPELYEAAAIDGASGWRRLLVDHPSAASPRLPVRPRHAHHRVVPDLRAGVHSHRRRTGRRHSHGRPASLRDRLPELLPVRIGHRDGLGAVHHHPGLLAAPVPPAPRPHGVLMASLRIQGPRRATHPSRATGSRLGRARAPRRTALAIVMAVVAVLWLLPVLWVFVTSLKLTENIIRVPPEWIPWPVTLAHYGEVLFSSSRTARIGRAFINSTIVSLGTVAVVLITSAMTAYPLARMQFRGRNVIFALLVGSLMIPNAVVLVPQYVLTQRLGWLSTYQGLIVPEAAMTFAFGVFLLRQFFLTIPRELEDAARIDGAGTWRVFTRIVLPLSQPVLAALAIFAFRSAWNDFLWPLIAVNRPEMFPLPVALALLRGAYTSESYGPIMAGATLSALPLLLVFLVANRRIVEGVRVSGLKG